MRQRRLDFLPGTVHLQPFGNTGHGPVPRRRGDESEQETGSPNDRGMLDDFRLWGSRPCRRGVSALQTWGRTTGPDMISTTTTPPSQRAEPAPLWSKAPPKRRTGSGTTRIPRVPCGQPKRGCASRVSLPRAAAAWRRGAVLVVGATPIFWPPMRHERGQGRTGARTPYPPLFGVAPTISDPCRKAEMKTWSQVIPVNLALTAVGLRV